MFADVNNSTKFKVRKSTINTISEPDKLSFLSEETQGMNRGPVHKISLQGGDASKINIAECNPTAMAQLIGRLAAQALLEEVNTSPKPGLVDRITNGAHKDMNLLSFYRSAEALKPYFITMALVGLEQSHDLENAFLTIRGIGMEAEAAMYTATGGVNTHKGLIFSLGILCTCVGSCVAEGKEITVEHIIEQEQRMVRRILVEELDQLNKKTSSGIRESHGEHLFKKMGVVGVRGEAINGFMTVRETGLPVMIEGLKQKKEFNLIKLQTLMTFMSQTEDTNVLSRTNQMTLQETQLIAREYLKEGGAYAEDGMERLLELDQYFTKRNISHGGCADLLAISIFMVSVCFISQPNPNI